MFKLCRLNIVYDVAPNFPRLRQLENEMRHSILNKVDDGGLLVEMRDGRRWRDELGCNHFSARRIQEKGGKIADMDTLEGKERAESRG